MPFHMVGFASKNRGMNGVGDLLVSCCGSDSSLFVVNTEKGTAERFRDGVYYAGIAITGSRIFVGECNGLLELDRSLTEVRRVDLQGPRPVGVHGIFAMDERLYLCATGWNTVTVLDIASLEPVEEIRLPGSEMTQQDKNHISSVWVDDEILYVSVHIWPGGKVPERPGAILALDRRTSRILEKRSIPDLVQPHSVVRWGEDLFYCVSEDRTLHLNGVAVARFRAYPRGLAVDESRYYVGQSRSRHDPGDGSACGVVVVDRKDGKREFIPLPATEVFEVALQG